MLDSLVFSAEAEIRWLDHCEARLRRAASELPAALGIKDVLVTSSEDVTA